MIVLENLCQTYNNYCRKHKWDGVWNTVAIDLIGFFAHFVNSSSKFTSYYVPLLLEITEDLSYHWTLGIVFGYFLSSINISFILIKCSKYLNIAYVYSWN